MTEVLRSENIEERTEEFIEPPQDTYFVHGVGEWSKDNRIGIIGEEISGSLQKDGHTKPIRSYGFVLEVEKGAISKAYDRDVTSERLRGKKQLSQQSKTKRWKEYGEDSLEDLIKNTPMNSHNEIWLNGNGVEIVGAYITQKGIGSPGSKSFLKACKEKNIPVRNIIESENIHN